MNYWKVILATIVIFGAGVITGGLLVGHVARPAGPLFNFRKLAATRHPLYDTLPPRLRPEYMNTNFVARLNEKLDLRPKQREQIRWIISQEQQNTHELWKSVAPQFQMVWRLTLDQINSVLTQRQKKEFQLLLRQQRQARRQRGTNAPPLMPHSMTNGPVI
ncbi:MAG: hypothetical protein ACREE6_05535 [Limisphaerales bacterium]